MLCLPGVGVREGIQVTKVEAGKLVVVKEGANGSSGASTDQEGSPRAEAEEVAFDECLWCTQAEAASWLKDTGLPTGWCGLPANSLACKG